jgi:hypothetical protein
MSTSTPPPVGDDPTYHLAPLPPASPQLDVGLAREKARIDANGDVDSVSTSTVEPLGSTLLPRGDLYDTNAAVLLGEAQQEAASGEGIQAVHLINAEADHQLAETRRESRLATARGRETEATDTLAEVAQRHAELESLVAGAQPDRDGIVWTNGRVETLRQEVRESMARSSEWLGDQRDRLRTAIKKNKALVAIGVLEFGLSLAMWFVLLNVALTDVVGLFGVFALTALTSLALTLVPHLTVPGIARAGRQNRLPIAALWLAIPVFVAIAVSVARQQFYLRQAQAAADRATAELEAGEQPSDGNLLGGAGDAGAAAIDLASALSLLDIYASWWMVPLFAVLLTTGIAWVLLHEVPRYNPHEQDYRAIYEQLLTAEREKAAAERTVSDLDLETQAEVIAAQVAINRAQVGQIMHREQWSHYIKSTIPALPHMQYEEYVAELCRIKGDPAFTAAAAVHLDEVRAARSSGQP